jgi:Peptidase family S41
MVPVIDGIAAHSALDTFEAALNQRWSYRHANSADFQTAIASLRKRIVSGIAVDKLGIELQKIVALGIDGHAGVSGYRRSSNHYLPFLIEATGERYVGFNSERTAFLADGFPFVAKIDGKNITEWLAAVAVLIPKGSPQYVRQNSLRLLREIDYWRASMGLPENDTIEVELVDKRGKAGKVITLPLRKSPLAYGVWPSQGSRLLNGEIGYLRLASMQRDTSVAEIKQWMPKFRDTAGLIVDVRDNNGGDRDALILLYSYFAAPDDPPRVFTAAAYRLHSAHKQNHLAENHRMYRANAEEWTSSQREAVARFAKSFKPQWMLPENLFSDWHYMALKRVDDQAIYHYKKPVIVLMNSKSFSATDIFLAGLKGIRNVLLLGTPSSGGSAFAQEIVLGSTPLRLRIGSIASFQIDGKLFDGNGILPDVLLEASPEYYIGGPDPVLEEAVKRIKRS